MLIDTAQFKTNHLAEDAVLPAAETALIIVDMMRRFCDPAWLSGGNAESERWFSSELETVIPNLRSILDAFRASGGLVVHVVNAKWTAEAREAVPYQRGPRLRLLRLPRHVGHQRAHAAAGRNHR